jgi:hypothetical protein
MDRICAGACGVSCRARASRYATIRSRFAPEGIVWFPRSSTRSGGFGRRQLTTACRACAGKVQAELGFSRTPVILGRRGMGADSHHSTGGRAGSPLGSEIAAHVEAIVQAAEREARAAERAIEERRRAAEEEVDRYLAAARLRSLSTAARRLADELSDAATLLTDELRRADEEAEAALPRTPWSAPAPPPAASAARHEAAAPAPAPPAPEPAPSPEPEPIWARGEFAEPAPPPVPPIEQAPPVTAAGPAFPEAPSAARLVAIEMAVSGSSRAEVSDHLREQLGVLEADELLDDVFGATSHAGSRLAWGEP